MTKKAIPAAAAVLLLLLPTLCGCGGKNDVPETDSPAVVGTAEPDGADETAETLSDEQALSAIRNYCFMTNPSLADIVKAEEYPVYWEIERSDEQEAVVLFRSYTGALKRFYIDRSTGEAYVTEYVPGITPEEQRTDETPNVRDYLSSE